MKKQEIEAVVVSLKRKRTETLRGIRDQLESIPAERERTQAMFFWRDFGDAQDRARFRERYDRDLSIVLPAVVIHYKRCCSPSRSYAYASDCLYLVQDDKRKEITTRDTKKIVAGIDAILKAREKKAAIRASKNESLVDDMLIMLDPDELRCGGEQDGEYGTVADDWYDGGDPRRFPRRNWTLDDDTYQQAFAE